MSNSLAAVHPELIVEWSDRNLPLTPDSVTFGSNKKVDLCQYFRHKKLNFSPSITYAERIIS